MTRYSSRGVWPTVKDATRLDLTSALRGAILRDVLAQEAVAVRRCAMYRRAISVAALNFPAEGLRLEPVAQWIRRHGVGVEVATAEDVDRAVASGITPVGIVMNCVEEAEHPVRRALEAGVGRFVIRSAAHVEILRRNAQQTQRVLIDMTDRSVDEVAAEVMSCERLDLIGLHCRLDDADPATTEDTVSAMVAEMAWVRRQYGVLMSRASLYNVEPAKWCCDTSELRDLAVDVEDAVEDACARYRYPHPALVLSLRQSAIITPEWPVDTGQTAT